MANQEVNVDSLNIDAIEAKMQMMSATTANKLGETAKKPQPKEDKK